MCMKKKMLFLIVSLVSMLSFTGNVFAANVLPTAIVENKAIYKGAEVSVKINVWSDVMLTACRFIADDNETFRLLSKSGANGWNVTQDGGIDGFLLESSVIDGDDLSNGKNVIELRYRVNNSGNLNIKAVQCINSKTEEKIENITDINLDIIALEPADNTTLSELKITNGTMNPSTISGSDISYIIDLSAPSFGISYTTSNPDYQDSVLVKDSVGNIYSDISNIKFNDPSGQGLMPITIVVNEKTTYSLVVHYEPTEYDNSLQSVTINGKEIVLNPGQYNYEYTVESNVNELVVAATIKDNENFKFGAASNAPGTFSIKDMVSFGIVVEPKDTSSGAKSVTYTFDVVKKGIYDGNFSIKYLEEDIKIALAISNEFLTVGLFKLDGTYDQNRLLLSNRKKAINWGLAIFNSYSQSALALVMN